MIQASRTLSATPLRPAFAHRPRARYFVPPEVVPSIPAIAKGVRWTLAREDMVFFAACYAAGLAFFLIMLS
ncbi:hypothetical protein [Sphingomonas sp. PR090111-T3T-6A]|uniref:hypothetical protein n=1 Tax=Sphingomonas sp. PR090111-T3T-6A TaxID=685778 RepID=UPI000362CE77|nr:hypothetical protein [Sphingomonas sp. PR090111-T3T-6A]